MENIQINGQKIWGPPKNWVGPPPPHGTEVFLKNIPNDVSEDELFLLFSTVGSVYEVRLPVHWTGENKGYAFVRFTKMSEADEAIRTLNSFLIRSGRRLKVERSLDNRRLFLSSVPSNKTGDEIKTDLLGVVENVKTVYVYPALENPTLFRGYAFVEFMCHRDAAIAKRILTPDVLFNLFTRKCVAAWANPLPFLSKDTLKNINILFMRNIPVTIKSHSIRLAIDTLLAPDFVLRLKRLNDYAFLTFNTHEMAESAMLKIKRNPYFLGLKAVHVEWAIPREISNPFSVVKDSYFVKEDISTEESHEEMESTEVLLKMLKNYANVYPAVMVRDFMNLESENNDSRSLGLSQNEMKLTVVQEPKRETDSMQFFNKCASICKADDNFLRPHIASNDLQNEVDKHQRVSQFRHLDSCEYYKRIRLQNWLQSLTNDDPYSSGTNSPTPPPTRSSTTLTWKWDEGYSRLSRGSGTSAGCL